MTKKNRSGRPRKTKRRGMSAKKKRRAGSSATSAASAAGLLASAPSFSAVDAASAKLFEKLATASTPPNVIQVLQNYTESELSEALKGLSPSYSNADLNYSLKILNGIRVALLSPHLPADAERENIGYKFVAQCIESVKKLKTEGVEDMPKKVLYKRITDLDPETSQYKYDRRYVLVDSLDAEKKTISTWIHTHEKEMLTGQTPSQELALNLVKWLLSLRL